jgi:hypothetical protein
VGGNSSRLEKSAIRESASPGIGWMDSLTEYLTVVPVLVGAGPRRGRRPGYQVLRLLVVTTSVPVGRVSVTATTYDSIRVV